MTRSPLHDKYEPVLEGFFEGVAAQEAAYVEAGFGAKGITAFMRRWFAAWHGDLELLEACLHPDVVYTDATTGGEDAYGRDAALAASRIAFEAVPDGVVYPVDGTVASLPYWDFTGDVARATVPWRTVGRWSAPLKVRGRISIPPTGRDLNFRGVDRYEFARVRGGGWLITRIDTDWDIVTTAAQVLPISMPDTNGVAMHAMAAAGRVLTPALRELSRTKLSGGGNPAHTTYAPMLPDFITRVRAQEKRLVKAGLPAAGMGDFTVAWFDAWGARDLDALGDLMAPEIVFTDTSTNGEERPGREITIDNCRHTFAAFPDLVFYPQDERLRALPYWDFHDGIRRAAFPWRGISRFTGPMQLPGGGPTFAPTGRCCDFVGVDRYVFNDDWKLTRIDTDWDMLGVARKLVPIPTLGHPVARISDAIAGVRRSRPGDLVGAV